MSLMETAELMKLQFRKKFVKIIIPSRNDGRDNLRFTIKNVNMKNQSNFKQINTHDVYLGDVITNDVM